MFETLTLPFTAAPPEEKVTAGDEIVSLAEKVNVTTSSGIAFDDVELLEDILTPLSVGAEVFVVTLPDPSVTAIPVLPAESVKAIL